MLTTPSSSSVLFPCLLYSFQHSLLHLSSGSILFMISMFPCTLHHPLPNMSWWLFHFHLQLKLLLPLPLAISTCISNRDGNTKCPNLVLNLSQQYNQTLLWYFPSYPVILFFWQLLKWIIENHSQISLYYLAPCSVSLLLAPDRTLFNLVNLT